MSKQTTSRSPRVSAVLLLLTVVVLTAPGCASLQSFGGSDAPADATAPPARPPRGMITVSLQEKGQMPEKTELPLDDSTGHVQAALVKAGAFKAFRRMDIQLIRSLPNGQRHKMEIPQEPGKQVVPLEYDYALRPGDHLICIEDPTTALDEMFGSAGKQLGIWSRGYR